MQRPQHVRRSALRRKTSKLTFPETKASIRFAKNSDPEGLITMLSDFGSLNQ